jgi:hypothetical protein
MALPVHLQKLCELLEEAGLTLYWNGKHMGKKKYQTVFRAKGLLDGCTTIDEMIGKLREAAQQLQQWEMEGVTLADSPVHDDYAYLLLEGTEAEAEESFGKGSFFETPKE